MQHGNTRQSNSALKDVAQCFGSIGWEKRLCDLTEEQVLGIIAVAQKARDLDNDYTEQGILEFEQSVTSSDAPDDLNDPIPF